MGKLNESVVTDYFIDQLPDLCALYLYGSRAQGGAGSASDVDLAVLTDSPLPSLLRFDLAQGLAAKLGCDVDLVDLRDVSTVMRMQVIAKGRRLFGDSAVIDAFEDRAFADYARLNEERAGILADIRDRGSIHGR